MERVTCNLSGVYYKQIIVNQAGMAKRPLPMAINHGMEYSDNPGPESCPLAMQKFLSEGSRNIGYTGQW